MTVSFDNFVHPCFRNNFSWMDVISRESNVKMIFSHASNIVHDDDGMFSADLRLRMMVLLTMLPVI